MSYFVTGASGFIGKRLVKRLIARADATVYFLMLESELGKIAALREFWGADGRRAIPVLGDITKAGLGVTEAEQRELKDKVEHFFHLAAVYDLRADAVAQGPANVEGTRHAVEFAAAIDARHFHHISSIAAAGLYDGVFREDMFEEAEHLEHPYFATKHAGEGIVRSECRVPWRIYRPGLVVGDSTTGEMDKVDGPYYFFRLIQKVRKALPPWMPTIGIEGGRINIVPVDFVVAALDHIAHLDCHDGECFHLTDPHPLRVGDLLNVFARAAHAPQMSVRINAALLGFVPQGVKATLMALAPVHRIRRELMKELGLPDGILQFVNYPTRFDCRETQKLLKDANIAVPPLEQYAWRLWDYWERHLDPDLFVDRTLRGRVAGRVVLITGGSSGIGRALALKIAEAGATTIIAARDPAKLAETQREAAAKGLKIITYSADIADATQCEMLVKTLGANHGGVDVLVNNAGRSIRRGIESTYERFHDYERTMQLNYFGALRLTMGLLPQMTLHRCGHVINISSLGVLTNAPRFSAYVASKAALDAWTNCAAAEFIDRGIEFTTVNMPLVRTPMTAPTRFYRHVPTLSPEAAADIVVDAIIHRPARSASRLGIFGQLMHAVSPRFAHIIMNSAFRMFPDSPPTQKDGKEGPGMPGADQIAIMQLLRGLHF